MSGNSYLTASDLTKRLEARMKYANYIIQKQAAADKCLGRIQLEGGSGGPTGASYFTRVKEGEQYTTTTDRDLILAQNACPGPSVPPLLYSSASILEFARSLYGTFGASSITPVVASQPLYINNLTVGNFEYTYSPTSVTVSSFNNSDWFTSTEDTVSSWIFVKGNMTINTGQTFIPTKRKLFTMIYVSGNLTVNGTITMSSRGANHSGVGSSGGYTAPVNIRLATGTYSSVTNPQIPATGGAGGARRSTSGSNPGTDGTNGGTGGGESGTIDSFGGTIGTAGAGATGTCFSGGGGGGSIYNSGGSGGIGGDAGANGGAGGDGGYGGVYNGIAIGGPGNPGGNGYYQTSTPDSRAAGPSGTAGTIVIICEGSLSGSGSVTSSAPAATSFGVTGSGGGGGSITVFCGSNPGTAVALTASRSGNGGNGSTRKLILA